MIKTTLGEISINGKGEYGIGASAVEYSSDLYTYLRITDINDDGTINKNGLKSVVDESADKYILQKNDIVFARTGASTGKNYFYEEKDGTLVYAGFLIKFSLDENKVNPKFIKYYCLSQEYKDWVYSMVLGSTRGNINAKIFAELPILLPERDYQNSAVKILSALDEKIELNNKINENLHAQAQAIFKSWFVDFEPFGGTMPSDWEKGKLGDLIKITSGKRPKLKQEKEDNEIKVPIIGASSVMGYTDSVLFDEKLLIIGRVGTHGIVQRVNFPCWASDNTLVINSNWYEYIYQLLLRVNYENLNRGSTQPLITQTDIKNIEILIPKLNLLTSFEQVVSNLMKKVENNLIENQKLAQIRDTLLPKLMSGELEV